MTAEPPVTVTCTAVTGIGEVVEGDDLAAVIGEACSLEEGDVVVVTSKVVSKSEGRLRRATREEVLPGETARVVARRGGTTIVRTRHGLVMAAAGVDASNTEVGTVLLLPEDPDGSARRLRERLLELTGRNVAVVVTDTAGRAWRHGQTDLAIGLAGLPALLDHAGLRDRHGNELAVTAPAVADEVAGLGDLVQGKLAGRPAAVVRGLDAWVLPAGDHGPGARDLVREEHQDMFGYGARDAVLHAVDADPAGLVGFGAPATPAEVVRLLGGLPDARPHVAGDLVDVPLPDLPDRELGRWEARVVTAAYALGWTQVAGHDPGIPLSFTRATP
jgi:coenzyme F420-0:L-glutamate ligase / coenzyme F420-1:gamma-L-glutamate ligase